MNAADFWNKAAPKYAKNPISDMQGYMHTLDMMKALLKPHHRVLEIGCGSGSTALELAAGVDRYIGTDVSSAMIEIAEKKSAKSEMAHLSFEVQPAETLPSGGHDVILALNLLHLLPNLEEVLENIYAALPDGGLFIAKTALLSDGKWFLKGIIPVMRLLGKAPYVRYLGDQELCKLLENAGFEMVQTLTQPGVAPRMFTVVKKV